MISSSYSFLFSEDDAHLFGVPNVCSEALLSSSAIAKSISNTTAPPLTVETQEADLTPHDPQKPPSPPHASTSSSFGVPTIVTQGGSSRSSNAVNNNNGQMMDSYKGCPAPSSVQTHNNKSNRVDSGSLYPMLLSN